MRETYLSGLKHDFQSDRRHHLPNETFCVALNPTKRLLEQSLVADIGVVGGPTARVLGRLRSLSLAGCSLSLGSPDGLGRGRSRLVVGERESRVL
jgi:hypothetical protein